MQRSDTAVWLAKRPAKSYLLGVRKSYGRLYDQDNFKACLAIWLLGLPFMARDFKNPYDGEAHAASVFVKSVYVTLPFVTTLPGLIELAWLPREHLANWWNAFQKTFVAGMYNIVPAGLVMYLCYGDVGTGSWTTRDEPYGWTDFGQLLLLLISHEIWFYITHRMNHTEHIYYTTHGHHHKNQGYVFMVNNSDVDVWELLSQGLWGLVFPLFFMKPKMFTHLAALGIFFSYSCTIHSTHWRPNNLHVVHHQQGRLATNYGLYTPLMDNLFGTMKETITDPALFRKSLKRAQ